MIMKGYNMKTFQANNRVCFLEKQCWVKKCTTLLVKLTRRVPTVSIQLKDYRV